MIRTWILFLGAALLLTGRAWAMAPDLPPELALEAPEAASMVDPEAPDLGVGQGLRTLWSKAGGELRHQLLSGMGSVAALLAGVTLLGVVESLVQDRGGRMGRYVDTVGALWITAVSAGDVTALMGLGQRTITEISQLSKVLLPAIAMSTAASGGVTSASVRQVAAVFFSDVLLTLMERVLLPGVYIYIGLAAADAVLGSGQMEPLGKLVKRVIVWGLCGLLTLFTGYITVSGAVAGAVDAHAVRAAKSAMSAAVPVVGRILSQAAETLLAGAGILRGMVGVFGALGVVGLCLAPVLRLGCQYFLYQGASLLSATVGPGPLTKLLSRLGDAFGLLFAMTASSAAVILISLVSSLTAVMP